MSFMGWCGIVILCLGYHIQESGAYLPIGIFLYHVESDAFPQKSAAAATWVISSCLGRVVRDDRNVSQIP